MAVDVCSEISSPRISFSHDLKELDFVPVEKSHLSPSDFNFNFDFDLDLDFFAAGQQISSADELFADGKILPVQIKKPHPIPPPQKKPESTPVKKTLIEFLSTTSDGGGGEEEEVEEKPSTAKPFWQFRRSSSVNCENGRKNSLLRSLHFLTRSNSTGSVPTNPNPNPNNNKHSAIPKIEMKKQQSLKEGSMNRANSYGPSFNHYKNPNNPTLRKSNSSSRSYGNGVRITPVLNIPPTFIAKGSAGLFGIGSFFCSKKSHKTHKSKK
ncbi:hypothetical protein ABFX02_05G034400 [Erythranthe guttata]